MVAPHLLLFPVGLFVPFLFFRVLISLFSPCSTGTDVVRPCGQLQKNKDDPKEGSTYGPCRLMDFELEMAFFVGTSYPLTLSQCFANYPL
jgi:hypothetical protein